MEKTNEIVKKLLGWVRANPKAQLETGIDKSVGFGILYEDVEEAAKELGIDD